MGITSNVEPTQVTTPLPRPGEDSAAIEANPAVAEDIFSTVDDATTAAIADSPVTVTAPVETAPYQDYSAAFAVGRRRRVLIIVGAVVLGLVLLGGGVWWAFGYLSQPATPISGDDTVQVAVPESVPSQATIIEDPPDLLIQESADDASPTVTFIDTDRDGLSDQEEVEHNTNPKKSDTDEDGLTDREEVRVYNTDPRNGDTDQDGFLDGAEVSNFYDPNSSNPNKRLYDIPVN